MTADLQTSGFPPGYFIIRSTANNRLFDVEMDAIEDGTEVVLWHSKEYSLVESMRNPDSNNQVFFIDTSGALCSRSSGHAIDIEDDRLVLRHRRPVSLPFPNVYSHPLPKFCYDQSTGEISVRFLSDPAYPPPNPSATQSRAWMNKSYILSAIPMRKPPSLLDDAAAFISSAIITPFSFITGASAPKATPDEVFSGDIDLAEDEVLEEERGEEAEADDSPDPVRRVRMLAIVDKVKKDRVSGEKARSRRRWEVIPLRKSIKRTESVAV